MTPAGTTRDVVVWDALVKPATKGGRWAVRWKVAGKPTKRLVGTQAQAKIYRDRLKQHLLDGGVFDVVTKDPVVSVAAVTAPTVLDVARDMLASDWDHLAPRSRQSLVEKLSYALLGFVPAGRQDVPGRAHAAAGLRVWLNPHGDLSRLSPAQTEALRWYRRAALRVNALTHADVDRALVVAGQKLDGTPCGRSVAATRRQALSRVLTAARTRGLLVGCEVQRLPKPPARHRQAVLPIDPVEVTSLGAARRLVDLVPNEGYRLLLMLMLYAGLRPQEAKGLRVMDVELAEAEGGRSRLVLRRAVSQVHRTYSNDGTTTQVVSPLKHRLDGQLRVVPIPHVLADLLRPVVAGRAADELLVSTRSGRPVSLNALAHAYARAREAWAEAEEPTPSALTLPVPYSLRHCCATQWLTVMPAPAVAQRLGHSVDVLLRVYANVISDGQDALNEAMDALV